MGVMLSDYSVGITVTCMATGCRRNWLTSLVSCKSVKTFYLTFSLRTSSDTRQSNLLSGTTLANHCPFPSTSCGCWLTGWIFRRSLPPGITAWIGSSKSSATCRCCVPRYDTTRCCTKTTCLFCGRSIATWKIQRDDRRRHFCILFVTFMTWM